MPARWRSRSCVTWILKLSQKRLRLIMLTTVTFLVITWKLASIFRINHNENLQAGQIHLQPPPPSPPPSPSLRLAPHPLRDSDYLLPYSEDTMAEELTVVSAFFDLGRFRKGNGDIFFTPNLYRRWMKSFAYLQNPVVMFVDNEGDAAYFRSLRSELSPNLTEVHIVSRVDLWAFSIKPKIKAIFSQPGYPKYFPNTVLPEYSCAMHAKYELMHAAIMENVFRTKYFCWLDVGLFRDLTEGRVLVRPFRLWLPPGFDADKVAYTEVESLIPDKIVGIDTIFTGNMVWVCGCFFVARAAVMSRWTQDYMKAVEKYINLNWMDTDQQVLYCMVKEKLNKIQVQTYISDGKHNAWFHLAYVCKQAGETRRQLSSVMKEEVFVNR